jgi:hypothetical protein
MTKILKEILGTAAVFGAILSWHGAIAIAIITLMIYVLLGDTNRCQRLIELIKAWRGR